MKVIAATEVPTRTANPDYFAGSVWQEPVHSTPGAAPVAALRVGFAPAARTNWHTHPGGQTLYVLSGVGLVQARGGPARRIREGDAIWIEPAEVHWHGADVDRQMVHLAFQHVVDGIAVTWLEPVSDADYAAASSSL